MTQSELEADRDRTRLEGDQDDLWDEPLEFPGWVSIAIGVTLVLIAALAVWQGAAVSGFGR